jgi:ATP-dependent DNA helicase RecG
MGDSARCLRGIHDRVEIRTPGQLPNTVTIDSLRLGVHVLRNATIYNIFLKIGLVTDAGSGIPRMIRRLRETRGSKSDLCLEGNAFIVALPRRHEKGDRMGF